MPTIINRRGRPPHPDILTPAEWQVLEGVRAGLTNQEIADQLGVTFHTVKYHISNMLGKLQLDDRQQLARWRLRREPSPVHRAWRSLLSLGGFKFVPGAMASAAVIGLGAISVLSIASLGGDEPPAASGDTLPVDAPEPSPALPTSQDALLAPSQVSPGITARLVDRGRTFTSVSMTAEFTEPFPEGIVPIAGHDLVMLAITPSGPRLLTGLYDDTWTLESPTTWVGNRITGPMPADATAIEIRLGRITLWMPGSDDHPQLIGPWTVVLPVDGGSITSLDLSGRTPGRLDTGFGWSYTIDAVERSGERLILTYHAEGDELGLLRREEDFPPIHSLEWFLPFPGGQPTTASLPIPPRGTSLTLYFGGVRRMESSLQSYDSAKRESGDWSITIPLN